MNANFWHSRACSINDLFSNSECGETETCESEADGTKGPRMRRCDAGGCWHAVAGTLTCQVVGFTPEPWGFSVKRPSQLEGPYSWLQSGSHCLNQWRGGPMLDEWKGNKRKTARRRRGGRRSSKCFQGAGPTWRRKLSEQEAV